ARGALPPLRAETRSGDTPPATRARLLRKPPEILITTPESLLLMLSSERGRAALATVRTVILDEVHALVGDRRGTVLLTALERLVRLTGEVQRIALSATVRPLAAVAHYVAGAYPDAGHDAARGPRPIEIISVASRKDITLTVRCPLATQGASAEGRTLWEPLAEDLRVRIEAQRSTLLFVNSRRLAEKLTFRINQAADDTLAFAHHGSLARELRHSVEQRLKSGQLRAIVATSSLEMGIDIGSLDEVVLIQSPPDVTSTLQRIGRAGHQVGAVSRATLYPTHPADFVTAAALARAVHRRDIEPMRLLSNPLDVLAQLIIAFTASEPWPVDDLYQLFRSSGPYRQLERDLFLRVLDMLEGRDAGIRVRELRPRIRVDRLRNIVSAERGAVQTFRHSGGVIPDRGYFRLRHADTGSAIGELDEEFVWESSIGQVFTFGSQNWQVTGITHDDVLARPTARPANLPPFWRSEDLLRSHHLAAHVGAFLADAEQQLAEGAPAALHRLLVTDRGFDDTSAAVLVAHLTNQRAANHTPLPHARHVVVERVRAAPGGYRTGGDLEQIVLHTCWGGRVNRPFALALKAALKLRDAPGDLDVDVAATDNAIVLIAPHALDPEPIMRLVHPDNLLPLLRATLADSGFFGARFREAAGRALLLTRQRFRSRMPLWVTRLQAKKLLAHVAGDSPDFPLLIECWRTCLNDEFDLPALTAHLTAIAEGQTTVSVVRTESPSPFAAGLAWDQIHRYMYADDAPDRPHTAGASAPGGLLDAILDQPALRPPLASDAVAEFLARRQRTLPDYAPESVDDWVDWVRERILLPIHNNAHGPPSELATHPDVAVILRGGQRWLAHRALLAALLRTNLIASADIAGAGPVPDIPDARDARALALELLSFHGPLTEEAIAALLPHVPPGLLGPTSPLLYGALTADQPDLQYCDAANHAAILRQQRATQRARSRARLPTAAARLPAFLAEWQGLTRTRATDDAGVAALNGFAAPVAVWLDDLPAARGIAPTELDAALAADGMTWRGTGTRHIRVGTPDVLSRLGNPDAPASRLAPFFTDPEAGYTFGQLSDRQAAGLTDFNAQFWQDVWNGHLATDDLDPLQRAANRDFELALTIPSGGHRADAYRSRHGRTAGLSGRLGARATLAWSGHWQLRRTISADGDAFDQLQIARDQARLLLGRYGMLCRELVLREGGPLPWRSLFRALRLMELAGEVHAGMWFESLSTPQFALPEALVMLDQLGAAATASATFWVSALDPVSPCGLGLDGLRLPARRPGNYLVFRNQQLALVVEQYGKRLIRCGAAVDQPLDAELLAPLGHVLRSRSRIEIELLRRTWPSGASSSASSGWSTAAPQRIRRLPYCS
ncbi:MAG: helicase-related protein, partial [Gammaproteobacteria bacterium]